MRMINCPRDSHMQGVGLNKYRALILAFTGFSAMRRPGKLRELENHVEHEKETGIVQGLKGTFTIGWFPDCLYHYGI